MDKSLKSEHSCDHCNVENIIDILYWRAAMNSWHENNDSTFIINGLRENKPIPKFAREFLADFIEEKAKRKPILNAARLKNRNRFIRENYKHFHEIYKKEKKNGAQILRGETPKSLAISALSKMYNLKISTIDQIVNRKTLR